MTYADINSLTWSAIVKITELLMLHIYSSIQKDPFSVSCHCSVILLRGPFVPSDFASVVSVVHLWRYRGGYPALTEVMNKLKQNQVTSHDALILDQQLGAVG